MPCLGYSNPFSDLFRPVCCHLQRLVSRLQGTTMRAACPLLDIVLTPNVQLRRLMRNAEASLVKICENDLWTVNERCSFHLETFHHIQWNIPWGQWKTKYCQYISSRQQKKQLTGTTNSNNYQTWRHWKIPCHLPIRVLAKQDSRRCSTASTQHDIRTGVIVDAQPEGASLARQQFKRFPSHSHLKPDITWWMFEYAWI